MNRQKLSAALRSIDRDFDMINHGGCAVIAAALAKELDGHLEDMRITTLGHSGVHDIDEVRPEIYTNNPDAWYDNGIGFKHVWIEGTIQSRHVCIDSTGVHEPDFFYDVWGIPATGSFTLEEIQELADCDDWNPAFNRGQIPRLRKRVRSTVHKAIHAE